MQTSAQTIAEILRGYRYSSSNEKELQRGIARVLTEAGLAFEREFNLGEAGTIDFLVEGGVGIEAKIKGALTAVTIQVHRYTRQPELRELVVATTLARHRNIPDSMNGKPVAVAWLGGAFR